jgi:NTP pyrophosphatase (non-canonical NTP hydrolase)
MITNDMIKKLRTISLQLKAKHTSLTGNHSAHVLARAAKVSEEYGELMDEILSDLGLQRADKLAAYNRQKLEKEYGDVVITLFLLGLSLDLDLSKVITARLKEIITRQLKSI